MAARAFQAMPGPKPLPVLGNSWRFALGLKPWKTRALDGVLWILRSAAGAGGAAKVSKLFGHPDLVFPFCADETARVYRREDAMPHRAVAPCLQHYKRDLRRDFFGEEPGLIGIHGEPWSRFRSKVSKALVAPEAARSAVPALDAVATDFVNRFDRLTDAHGELPDAFLTELYKWALESVGAFALGTRLGCLEDEDAQAREIISCIHGFFHSVPRLELSAPLWRLYRTRTYDTYVHALDTFRKLCLDKVHQAVANKQGACARVAEESGEKVAAILALDLLLVGVDTTAAAAASTLYLLARNKRAQRLLQKELDANLKHGVTMSCKDLDRLPYLKACIKEALRIKPVILGNGRCLQADTVLAGYEVPKGSHVVFPHYVLSNEDRYFPSPEQYVPERWLRDQENERLNNYTREYANNKETKTFKTHKSTVEHNSEPYAGYTEGVKSRAHSSCRGFSGGISERNGFNTRCPYSSLQSKQEEAEAAAIRNKQREIGIHPFASLPFGFGRRMCIGKRFAEAELQLLIAKVFHKYEVSWRHAELTYSVTPTYVPNEPLKFALTARAQGAARQLDDRTISVRTGLD